MAPSVSRAQHNLMAMVANNPKAAKRVGISKSTGEEFMKADKGKKFGKGGLDSIFKGKESYSEELKEGKAIKSGKISPQQYAKGEKMEKTKMNKGDKAPNMGSMGMKKGGVAKCMAKGGAVKADGKAIRGKTKGRFV
jgi:hypothetical protein